MITEQEFIERYDTNNSFDEEELETIVDGLGEEVDVEFGENRRWSRIVKRITKICDRYFAFIYDEGLTEYQDNDYNYQPYEVRPIKKVVTITEWEKV